MTDEIRCLECDHMVEPIDGRCPICSADLSAREEEPPHEEEELAWAIVRTVSTEVEAQLIAGRLIASGIPAVVLSQVDRTRGFTVGALAVAKVFVPEDLLDEANELLSAPDEDLLDE